MRRQDSSLGAQAVEFVEAHVTGRRLTEWQRAALARLYDAPKVVAHSFEHHPVPRRRPWSRGFHSIHLAGCPCGAGPRVLRTRRDERRFFDEVDR